MLRKLSTLGALLFVACAAAASGSDVLSGHWGGNGVSLDATASGATLEFDCGSATIDEPIAVRDGAFAVAGHVAPGTHGPTRNGDAPKLLAARFEGTVSGDAMQLVVTLTESGETFGRLALTRDAAARLHRCMGRQ